MVNNETIEKEIKRIVQEDIKDLSEERKKEMEISLKKIYIDGVSPKKAFNIDDELLNSLYGYAYRLFHAGKFKEAEVAFLFLFQMDPSNVTYAKALAFAYKEQNQNDMAAMAFATWGILDPNDPIPPYYRAEIHMIEKDYKEAYMAYAESILKSLRSSAYDKLRERAYLNIECLKERVFPEKTDETKEQGS